MLNEGIYEFLQKALATWNEKLGEVYQLLTTSPQGFKGGAVWSIVENVHSAMQGIGYALLVLFFLAGVLHSSISFQELKRPEQAIKLFLRFAIAKGVVTYGMDLLLALISISQGVLARILSSAGLAQMAELSVPAEIEGAIDGVSFFASIPLWALSLVGNLVVIALAFVLIMTVYGCFLRLYMFTALSPIPLSAFAGENTQHVGTQFLKNYLGVCMEFVCIALACVLSSALMITPEVDSSAGANTQVFSYLCDVIFNMLVLVGTTKACEHYGKELVGLA